MTETLTMTSSVLLLGLKTIECLAAASDEKFLLFDLQSLDRRFDNRFFDFFDLQSLDKQFDDGFFGFLNNLVNFFHDFVRYSLDKQFDDGLFNFLDNLINFFDGFIRYSLDWFDDGFFDSFDNLANFFGDFVEYSSFFACFSTSSGSSTSTSECFIGSSSLTAPYKMGAMTCSYPIKYI